MKNKFLLSLTFGISWLSVSIYFAINWVNDISNYLPKYYVWFVIIGIALLPGFLMSTMFFSNILNSKIKRYPETDENVTILMCAKNEAKTINGSINCIINQTYKGKIKLFVIDNNSTDNTREIVKKRQLKNTYNRSIKYYFCKKNGKCHALNQTLKYIKTKYFITVDADTFLDKRAIQNIMNHIVYKKCGCVAGNLFVQNTKSFISKMQTYDYLLSIAAIKRYQGSYNSTLVAQGAFSAYNTEYVKASGGWKECLGEDIVLTYGMLKKNIASTYEPTAIGYTSVPVTIRKFYRQRRRWAIGMLEGLSFVKPWQQGSIYSKYFTLINVSVIFIDFSYILGFIPGVIFLLLGHPYFVGVMTLYALGISAIIFIVLYRFQEKIGIPFRKNFLGFFFFLILFQAFQSIASIHGYLIKIFNHKSTW